MSILLRYTLFCLFGAIALLHAVLAAEVDPVPPENKFSAAPSSDASPQDAPESLETYQLMGYLAQGSNCAEKANSTLAIANNATLLYTHGNDNANQRMHIYHSKDFGITVSWAGMQPLSLGSLAAAGDLFLVDPDNALFPGLRQGTKVYDGFQKAFQRVAPILDKKIPEYQERFNDTRVSFTGLSYGAALSVFAGMHFQFALKHGVYKLIVFGLPRLGNVPWANSVDDQLKGTLYYTANGDDIVVHLPPREAGYQHPSGQIWTNPANSLEYKFYPGQENVHGADSIWGTSIEHHTGIYYGVHIGGAFGPCPVKVAGSGM
ncbi:hypothetical protein MVES1_003252 [Malassezia vespertilionis]|uniref:Fungal lipase-type domain-containing protein n=1 Tax=Malassezia vespertilionis TaxID=2020962 RepID=A0A2N1J9F4_9BASI|nr:uncharacterized protein MVES1_003252 [Malassezia vespertilionis]PKI83174.1 hypothetical protein MVES_003089 [Malassezia vespertilionis]WFD07884.1 hypothetical protein MVES1_003252 [Malassezia vespertilionis]